MNFYSYKCRACRIETQNCIEMNKPFGNASTLSIVECMNLCTGVPASQSDGLPNHICNNCNAELRTTYNFIQKVRDSDEFFLKEFKLTVISDPLFVDQNAENPTELNVADVDSTDFDFNVIEPKMGMNQEPGEGPSVSFNISGDLEDSSDEFNWADNSQNDGFSDSSDDRPLKSKIDTKKAQKVKKKAGKKKCGFEAEDSFSEDSNDEDCTATDKRTEKDENASKLKSKRRKSSKESTSKAENKDSPASGTKKKTTTEEEKKTKEFIEEKIEILSPKKVENPDGEIEEQQQFRCKICSNIFSQKTRLATHIKYVHMKIRNYLCTYCPKTYFFQASLDTHMSTHNGHRPFKCDKCERSYSSKYNLDAHKRTHSDERPYVCTECGKSFKFEKSMKGHMFLHTRKGHECKVCGKNFAQPIDLRRHFLSHTGEKPYKCDLCPSIAYQHSSTLVFHMKKHNYSGASCKVCKEEISSFEDWRTHKNLHKK